MSTPSRPDSPTAQLGPAAQRAQRWLARVVPSIALATALAPACKPSDEPDLGTSHQLDLRVDAHGPGAPTGTVRVGAAPEAAPPAVTSLPLIDEVPHDPRSTADAEAAPALADATDTASDADAMAADAGPVAFVTRPDELPASLRDELMRPVPAERRETARAKNKAGLEKHRRLELAGAIEAYREAITAAPPSPFPRYNLACALALSGQQDEALHHLAVLAYLADRDATSAERLAAARVDGDFERLRDDVRFRALTLATPVRVTWAAGTATSEADAAMAKDLAKALREAKWASQVASTPWQLPVERSVMKVRRGSPPDPVTEAAARAMHAALRERMPDLELELGQALPPDGPPVVLIVRGQAAEDAPAGGVRDLVAEGEAEGAPPAEGEGPAPTEADEAADPIAPYIGRRMRRESDEGSEILELDAKGFFRWELVGTTGERRKRAGRWTVSPAEAPTSLELVFRETVEAPNPEAPDGPPNVTVNEGLESRHKLELDGRFLRLDGRSYR